MKQIGNAFNPLLVALPGPNISAHNDQS